MVLTPFGKPIFFSGMVSANSAASSGTAGVTPDVLAAGAAAEPCTRELERVTRVDRAGAIIFDELN